MSRLSSQYVSRSTAAATTSTFPFAFSVSASGWGLLGGSVGGMVGWLGRERRYLLRTLAAVRCVGSWRRIIVVARYLVSNTSPPSPPPSSSSS